MNRVLPVLLFAMVACDNKSSGPAPAASASASAAPVASASASAAPSAAPSASAAPTEGAGAWSGSYKSAAGTVTLPVGKPYEGATWANDDGGVGIGDGTLSINVDAAGVVTGGGEGAIGAFLVDGLVKDGQMTATVARKDPSDRGLTGTVIGKVSADKIDGTMNLSLPEASGVRKGTFTLAKK